MLKRSQLDKLYRKYNRREYVHPDPLEFLFNYPDAGDMEIAGLVAALLAYGRVGQILKSVHTILNITGDSPRDFLLSHSHRDLQRHFAGFKHRFATDDHLVALCRGIQKVLRQYGTLNECFLAGMKKSDKTVIPALTHFVQELDCLGAHLVPDPKKGSACKRLMLYLRWMVRKDSVDPGGWEGVPKSKLVIPLDTHMAQVGRAWSLSRRKSADMRMALEITDGFRAVAPRDPVKYDFCLTRFGIRKELSAETLLNS